MREEERASMRLLMAPIYFVGRVLLWIVFLPVGIWRSVIHRRKKEQRRREKFEREMQERQFEHERQMANKETKR